MQDLCMWISCAHLCVRISASGSCMTTCARSLYEDLWNKMSVLGCLYQEPLGPLVQDHRMKISCARSVYEDLLRKMSVKISSVRLLVQDLCMRISCAYLCVKTSARSLYADLSRKISVSGSLHQGAVGPLVQDLCMRISCARRLRSLQQNPGEALVQDQCMRISCARCLSRSLQYTTSARSLQYTTCAYLCVRISASGSCMTTCARFLYADLLCKISLSGCLQQDP